MNYQKAILTGAVLAALAVALGAFGAHLLKPMLLASGRAETYELAVRYQFYHALALIAGGILIKIDALLRIRFAILCFFLGVIFFSGSLYALCFTGIGVFGAITPIGGTLFLAGWLILIFQILRR